MIIGNNIKILRTIKGMTQKDLSEKVHVSFQTVSKWEKGEIEPDITTLNLLCSIFETSIDDLVNRNLSEENPTSKKEYPAKLSKIKEDMILLTRRNVIGGMISPILFILLILFYIFISFLCFIDDALPLGACIAIVMTLLLFVIKPIRRLIRIFKNNFAEKTAIKYFAKTNKIRLIDFRNKTYDIEPWEFIDFAISYKNGKMLVAKLGSENGLIKYVYLGWTNKYDYAINILKKWAGTYTI